MKNAILYYHHKETIDRVTEIVRDNLKEKINRLQELLLVIVKDKYTTERKISKIRNQIIELNEYLILFEDGKEILAIDSETKNKIEEVFYELREGSLKTLSDYILDELYKQDAQKVGEITAIKASDISIAMQEGTDVKEIYESIKDKLEKSRGIDF